jgi:hypothetical protein
MPASGRNRGGRPGSHFSGLAGVEAWAPAADLPPFPGSRAERCRRGNPPCSGAIGKGCGPPFKAVSSPIGERSHFDRAPTLKSPITGLLEIQSERETRVSRQINLLRN